MYLMARHAFETLGYRRYEWKCNAFNEPSRRAAVRLGFQFEGIFRQHMIVKGRSRDTAWFAMIDRDWPAIRAAYDAWLDPANFDAGGRQLAPLRIQSPPRSSSRHGERPASAATVMSRVGFGPTAARRRLPVKRQVLARRAPGASGAEARQAGAAGVRTPG
jgi:hypothetical protein